MNTPKLKLILSGLSNCMTKRYFGPFWFRRRWLKKTQWLSQSELETLQLKMFQWLIRHCYDTVPYYRQMMDERNISVDEIVSISDIQRFPILTKADVVQAGSSMFSTRYPHWLLHSAYTGGSTGARLPLRRDIWSIGNEHAFVRRQYDWAHIGLRDRCAYLTWREVAKPNSPCSRPFAYDPFLKELILSTFHLSEDTIPAYVEAIQQYRICALVGYPSAIGEIAHFLLERRKTVPLRSVLTTSEMLGQQQRKMISEAFACPVYDFYGSAERVCYIHTCEKGSYHIVPEYGLTELVPCQVPNEDCCKVISTGFWNRAMPLIRYDMGDMVRPSPDACSCGRFFKTVESIVGRESRSFQTRTGRLIGLTALTRLLKNVLVRLPSLPIKDSQFVYDDQGTINFEYIPASNFTGECVEKLQRILGEELPDDFGVIVHPVSQFHKTVSGKSVSLVKE